MLPRLLHDNDGAEKQKMRINSPEDPIIEKLLTCFYLFLGAGFVIFSSGKQLAISFYSAAYLIGAALLIVIVWILSSIYRENKCQPGLYKKLSLVSILIPACVTGLVSSSINRPDIDDSVYAPKAVFYTEAPHSILDQSIIWIAGIPEEARSFVFQYYETLQAALAWLFGAHFLTVYHVIFPFLVGLLSFLSIYLLLGLFFEEAKVRLAGSVLLILLMLLLGETHRAYGNLSIGRAFHGKYALFFLGFYSWVYFSLKYFHEGRVRQVLHLAVVAVALSTLTTTTLIYIPFLSLTIYFAYFLSGRSLLTRAALRIGVGYFIALLPIAILAVNFRNEAQQVMPAGSAINSSFPSDFYAQARYLINDAFPFTPYLFFASLLLVILFSPYRTFFILWVLVPIVLLLNPVVSGFVIKNITTENAYWRMFYLIPFPFITAVAFCSIAKNFARFRTTTAAILIVTFVLIIVLPSSVLRKENGAYFEFLSYKIHEPVRSFVKEFSKIIGSGSCFAPIEVSSNLVIYTSKFPQYYLREDYLGLIVGKYVGEDRAAERRHVASYLYADLKQPAAEESFHRFISQYKPDCVVLRRRSSNATEAGHFLSTVGYSVAPIDGYEYQVWRINE